MVCVAAILAGALFVGWDAVQAKVDDVQASLNQQVAGEATAAAGQAQSSASREAGVTPLVPPAAEPTVEPTPEPEPGPTFAPDENKLTTRASSTPYTVPAEIQPVVAELGITFYQPTSEAAVQYPSLAVGQLGTSCLVTLAQSQELTEQEAGLMYRVENLTGPTTREEIEWVRTPAEDITWLRTQQANCAG